MVGVMVGMLVIAGADFADIFGHGIFGAAFVSQSAQVAIPGHPSLRPELYLRREGGRIVERSGGDVQMRARRIVIEQRRAAFGAKAAGDEIGTLEKGGCPPCPCKGIARDADQGGEEIAHRLLAHPAMADVRCVEHGGRMIAHRTALASAGNRAIDALHVAIIPIRLYPGALTYSRRRRG